MERYEIEDVSLNENFNKILSKRNAEGWEFVPPLAVTPPIVYGRDYLDFGKAIFTFKYVGKQK